MNVINRKPSMPVDQSLAFVPGQMESRSASRHRRARLSRLS